MELRRGLLFLSLLFGFSIAADANPTPPSVLVQKATHVYFTQPGYEGTYLFQVHRNGFVERIDNKGRRLPMAQLAAPVMKRLLATISGIKNPDLTEPPGPPCMDAPSSEIRVLDRHGKLLEIWRQLNCKEWNPKDSEALKVVHFLNSLDAALRP